MANKTDISKTNKAGSTGRPLRVIMSGGGTGGHIFPAVAIAQEIKRRVPNAEILFIGANGKMEMEKVPQAGFKIEGLNIAGFDRGNMLANFKLPFKLVSSVLKSRRLVSEFKPDFVVGTGGYASGPALYSALQSNVPAFIQEQNSLPGKTNLYLGINAKAIFTAYPDMQHFFSKSPVKYFGNPVRGNIITGLSETAAAKRKMGLDPQKLTVLSVGGSLGSATLNNAWKKNIDSLTDQGYQLIWQTGKLQYGTLKSELDAKLNDRIKLLEFITDMPLAYSAADVIVSRAGAIAISELALVQKPVILVPFPFAAEDHQTKNAQALVEKNAARMVKDSEMDGNFWPLLSEICKNEPLRREMSDNLKYFAKPDAAKDIVDEIFQVLKIHANHQK